MSKEANTSDKSEVRGYPVRVPRMLALESACGILGGQKPVADALGITVRAVYDKREGNTGISDAELRILVRDLTAVSSRCHRISTNLLKELGEVAAADHQAAS
jgi:hypothetical protein